MKRTNRVGIGTAMAIAFAGMAPAAHAASGTIQLVPVLEQLLVLLVGFSLLIPVVNRLIVRPVYGVFDERADRIAGARERAAALEASANEVITRYEAGLRAVREENDRTRSEHVNAARADQEEITAQARGEADAEVEQSLAELSASLESAREGLRATAEGLARDAAAQILGRPLS